MILEKFFWDALLLELLVMLFCTPSLPPKAYASWWLKWVQLARYFLVGNPKKHIRLTKDISTLPTILIFMRVRLATWHAIHIFCWSFPIRGQLLGRALETNIAFHFTKIVANPTVRETTFQLLMRGEDMFPQPLLLMNYSCYTQWAWYCVLSHN